MFGEAHAHMVLDGVDHHVAIERHKNAVDDSIVRANLKAYQDRGVDFVRDGGDRWGVCSRARELAPEYGIDYRIPTFPITQKGHYGSFIGRAFETIGEYRQLVAEAAGQGADFIKLMIAGICDFKQYGVIMFEPLADDLIREEIHIAHEEGFAVMAHANGAAPIRAALQAGVDSIEHGSYMDEETLCMLAESDTVWVPTMSTYGNLIGTGDQPDEATVPLMRDNQRNVRFAYDKGAKIAVGSDAGAPRVFHGDGIFTEYGWLKKAIGNRPELDRRLEEADAILRRKFKRQ